ncbi:MAG: DUF2892 domain-containing protein [bacterium]
MIKQNENLTDRLFRGLLASLLLLGGYYWFGGAVQIIFYVLGAVMLFTAATGFCALYAIFGIDTNKILSEPGKIMIWTLSILILVSLVAGSYASSFFTRKTFVEDFNTMNNNYKQTLFNTGQNKRPESIANYDKLVASFSAFQSKYKAYKPVVIRSDSQFDEDLEKISGQITSAKDGISNGDLPTLHKELEPIRTEFQDILKRNNFSMLGMALSDFHDAMEVSVEAGTAKDANAVIAAYPDVDAKLKIVEEMANDSEIQTIRANLETLTTSAKNNKLEDLPKQGADLKSSFIKVYLKRG